MVPDPLNPAPAWTRREIIARLLGILFAAAFLFKRTVQLQSFPGIIGPVRGLLPWFEKFSFLPRTFTGSPFPLDLYYSAYGYSPGQVRLLWWTRLLIWCVETGILLAYIVAFLTRKPARSLARGFMETAFPLLIGVLPFSIVMTDYTYHQWFPERSSAHMNGLYAINAVLILGGAINVLALISLRSAFTIMSEARVFVRSGLYRLVRHPLYAAHFAIYLCYTLLHFHAVTIALYIGFVIGQTVRACIEERKMLAAFPEYADYRRTTGMFFPRVWGSESRIGNPELKP